MSEDYGVALHIVDQLHVDVVQRTIDVQPRPLRCSEDLLANALVHVPPVYVFRCPCKHKKGPWSFLVGRWPKPKTKSDFPPPVVVCVGQRQMANDQRPVYFAPVLPTFFFKRSPA